MAKRPPKPDKPKRRFRMKRPAVPKPPAGMITFFLRGMVTLAPALLTLVVFGLVFQMINRYVTGPINSFIYWSLESNSVGWDGLDRLGIDPLDTHYLEPRLLPLKLQDQARDEGFTNPTFLNALRDFRHSKSGFFRDLEELGINPEKLRADVRREVHPLIGVVLSFLLVLWLGFIVGGYMGRGLVSRLDQMMQRIPIVKSVYPYSKQLVEFFFADNKMEFDRVVCLPYPSRGLWSIGFVTSTALKTLTDETGKNLVSVFIPSSPMPMTGYTIFAQAEDLIPIPISVDEALRITMTGGVLIPPAEAVAGDPDDFLDEREPPHELKEEPA